MPNFTEELKMLAFQTRSTRPKYHRIPELTTWHQSCSRSSGIRVSEWRETFDVTVVGNDLPDRSEVSGSLVWSDGVHNVRSPIVVYAFNVSWCKPFSSKKNKLHKCQHSRPKLYEKREAHLFVLLRIKPLALMKVALPRSSCCWNF